MDARNRSNPPLAEVRVREKTRAVGVYKIHARRCPAGSRCRCAAAYQATVFSPRDGKLLRKHFDSLRGAEMWRGELRGAVDRGEVRATTRKTVSEAGEALIAGMVNGTIVNRSGRTYKPSTIRRYELALRLHIIPAVGHLRLADVDRARVRALIRAWTLEGRDPSSIRNELDPLRVIFREAIEDGEVTVDPMVKLVLPHGRGRRERVADRTEAQLLLEALPVSERALWTCAFYGGLRRGELRSLRWSDVDLEAGVIAVSRTMDDKAGEVAAKTEAGERTVPLAGVLRRALVEHRLATGRGGDQLVFGRTPSDPFTSSTVGARAYAAWEAAGLTRITLHEARHSAASYLIEAGLNDLELTAMIGHSDPRTTKAIYGHLFPDSRVVVAAKLDAYLGTRTADVG